MGENRVPCFPRSCFQAHGHVLWSSLSPLNKGHAGSSSNSAILLSTGVRVFHAVVSSRVGQAKTVLTFWRGDGPQLLSSFWVLICFKTNPNPNKSTLSWHNILQDCFGTRQNYCFVFCQLCLSIFSFCFIPSLCVHSLPISFFTGQNNQSPGFA